MTSSWSAGQNQTGQVASAGEGIKVPWVQTATQAAAAEAQGPMPYTGHRSLRQSISSSFAHTPLPAPIPVALSHASCPPISSPTLLPCAAHPQLPGPRCLVQPSLRPQSHPAAAAGRGCRRCCCRRRGQRASQPLQAEGGPRQPTAASGGTEQLQRVSRPSSGGDLPAVAFGACLLVMGWQALLCVAGRGMAGLSSVGVLSDSTGGGAAAECTSRQFDGRGLQRAAMWRSVLCVHALP